MEAQHARTEALLGKEGLDRLRGARVAVFGVGGVGGFAVEALARSGIGKIDLIDADRVSITNVNRQIIATHKTLGQYKTEAMKNRIAEIDESIEVRAFNIFFDKDSLHLFDFSEYDYVVDAIDSVRSKIELITAARVAGVPVICSGGAGNKLDPTAFTVADISKTEVCPLCRAVRVELKKRGVKGVKAVFSKEPAREGALTEDGQRVPASVAFVPSVVGLIIAGEVIKDIAKVKE